MRLTAQDEKFLAHRRTTERVRRSLQLSAPRPPKRPPELRTVYGRWVDDA